MARLTVLLVCFFFQAATAQDKVSESDVKLCRWLSVAAKDIMVARQDEAPMPETLSLALNRLNDYADYVGVNFDELSAAEIAELQTAMENFNRAMEPLITALVESIYQEPSFSSQALRDNAASKMESSYYAQCVEGGTDG